MTTEIEYWWLIVLPLFFTLGWLAARVDIRQLLSESTTLPATYFKGLNFLIDDQHDKAVEAFSEAISINSDSLELHFALGSLFRRTGETDRAINMHLNMLDKKVLTANQKNAVKAELAQDYLKAGLFDRAEELFIGLDDNRYRQPALNALLEIYGREREWGKAVTTATELERLSGITFRVEIAQYYCELAMNDMIAHNPNNARTQLDLALNANKNCIRASVLLGDLEAEAGAHKMAISFWKRIEYQQPQYLGLIAKKMLKSYRADNDLKAGLEQLNAYLETYQLDAIMSVLYEATLAEEGADQAAKLARNELIRQPSLTTLDQLLQARAMANDVNDQDIQLMQQTVRNAIGYRVAYYCNKCGFRAKQYHWQCPACNAWETLPAEPSETFARAITVKNS